MSWLYSKIVKKHFLKPRNFLVEGERPDFEYNGEAEAGNPACGDTMKMWLYIDPKTERIKKCAWRTFGCASAIASTSVFSTMITKKGGMKLNKALKITPQNIIRELGGLPSQKIHCSVLCDQVFRKAVNDYFQRTKQHARLVESR